MAYKLKVTGRGFALQWMEKPDGTTVRSSAEEWVFVVDSNYKDRIDSESLLKQTGYKGRIGIGRPSTIMNANGWKVELI